MNDPDLLFTAKRFRVVRVVQETPDGTPHTREIVRHPGAVAILPVLDDGRIVLIENYRVSSRQTLVELPAGTLEPGEDPQQAAVRELAEETGYRAGRIQPLTVFYTSPGILDELMHLYLATAVVPGATSLDPGEDIRPLVVTLGEALEMIRDGRIRDGKSLAGLLYYDKFCRT